MFVHLFWLRSDGVSSRRRHKEARDALYLRTREKGSLERESKKKQNKYLVRK